MMRMMLVASLVWASLGCDDTQAVSKQPAPAATALRLAFPGDVANVVCNGRALPCVASDGLCLVDLDARAQNWPDAVVLCQGALANAPQAELFAPVVPVVFKDGLPIWTPNLDADGQVIANVESTALGMAFLSPYLTATWPETARAVLGQTQASPYFGDLVAAVSAQDIELAAGALPPLAADVISQASLTQTERQPLSDSERSFGMDNIKVERTSGYITMDSRLGTSVDHICVLYALYECGVESEVELASIGGADTFTKTKIGRSFVPAKSIFNLQILAKTALRELFGDLIPSADLETFRLEPGRVHDIQCYSGSLGLLDEADARTDQILIDAEPEGRYFVNFARVANLISVALDTLRLFIDFDAFGEQGDIAKAVAVCAEEAIGPTLAVADGTTREAWFNLLKVVQTCAIKRLGVVLAKRGVHALAVWVFDFASGGGGGWVGKVTQAGMILDRVIGMTVTMSPVQRLLLAENVDFEVCAPCVSECDSDVCADAFNLRYCVHDGEECTVLAEPQTCGPEAACADGACVDCGGSGEPCCPDDVCDGGLGCDAGECVDGCREECPANGITRCASRGAMQVCGEHDGDPCLEWGAAEDCGVGEACEVDACGPPSCENECGELGWLRCTEADDGVEVCGQCDDDGCTDWCPEAECEAGFVCSNVAAAACTCDDDTPDLPTLHPGEALADLTDDGVSHVVSNSLWPARDADVISAYVTDTIRGTLIPEIAVTGAAPGLTYDVCIAFACDPEVNSGEPSSVDCGDSIRTTRDGAPACCLLSQSGDVTVDIEVNCTLGGLRDDSGTATAYVEAVDGSQCAPPLRMTLTGGRD